MKRNGTSLDEDQNIDDLYTGNHGHMPESSYEDDGDGDYEEEMTTEETDEFESVDSESFHNEDHLENTVTNENHNSDDHVAHLIETFSPQTIVEVNVCPELDKRMDSHTSPNGRGRDRNNTRGGRQNTRGRGGRFAFQQTVVIPRDQNHSN
ncbi:hypothetical protein K7X08_017915 [Anisodus acutangulus]|uniref:Uncharacterized protein n=1 Tax=Anisodus acutangulus TaxID=402998 RepID=A0A9Q1LY92_9SOLA|nr:hypothetical protein K7X08_017915 [Anisodus acutangulus]